ncbi:hypothetical protein OG943_10295 [Amycolatopsis sp. NBC_00345]|uniref:hypothetical protein n=1 Tax=Amycolatopsis sp. NBC_00345 TaxID=2975955 RepID=UPI002E25D8C1
MRIVQTSAETTIGRNPGQVYEFVTTPANWVGTHPVTAAVEGATQAPAAAGARWIEVIRPPDDPTGFRTEWLATLAAPGHTWVIETDRLLTAGVRCQIAYTFTDHPQGTYFRRDMSVLVDDTADVEESMLANLSDGSAHEGYLEAVKAVLER